MDDLAGLREKIKAGFPSPLFQSFPVGDLLTRYQRGEHQAVWQFIRELPAQSDDLAQEVAAVATETMRRAGHNLDLISERLDAIGWHPLMGELRPQPGPKDHSVIQAIESIAGCPVPASLLAFWRVVGGVDFVWSYKLQETKPDLGLDASTGYLDALFLSPARDLEWSLEGWKDLERLRDVLAEEDSIYPPYDIELSMDYYHKEDVSGGAGYTIFLPQWNADPVLAFAPIEMPFTEYLRFACRWAGFPGLAKHPDATGVSQLVATLGAGMEPF
ncbi:SMI1/KNR4 family protein [Halovulum sp. GXIMD14793]